jgi:ABC-type transporter Mla subunit MlaD
MIPRVMSAPVAAAHDAVMLLGVPGRVEALLDRVDAVLTRVEGLVDDVDAVADSAAATAAKAAAIAERADGVAARAEAVTGRVETVMDKYGDSLGDLAPLARDAAAGLTTAHVTALISALDQLPEVVDLITPAMRGLAALAPDLDELLDRLNAVGEIVEGLPGASMFRKRGQSAEDEGEMEP